IPFGTYTIREEVPSGWQATTANPQIIYILDRTLKEAKFGNRQVPVPTTPPTTTTTTIPTCGYLKVFKFNDYDGDGVWDSNEPRLGGFLFHVSGPTSMDLVTDSYGEAYTGCIPFGTYTIREEVPSGWQATTANPQIIYILDRTLKEAKFGNRQVPVPTTPPTTTTTICPSNRIEIISTQVDPNDICKYEDRKIKLKADVRLEQGLDNSFVTVKFYVEDDNGYWEYIGSDSKTMYVGQTSTFTVNYYYHSRDLNLGSHRIKFVASTSGDEDIEYDTLYISSCDDGCRPCCYDRCNYDIKIRDISLNPTNPKRCEKILFSVPVEVLNAPYFPQDVYVDAYIDGKLEYSTTIRYYKEETRFLKFTIDSCDYNTGPHSIRIDARLDGIIDTYSKSFTIGDGQIYFYGSTHCLDIEKIWTNKPVQPDEDIRVYAKVKNCGIDYEPEIRGNLEAFGMVKFDGFFSLPKDGYREISFDIHVPENASGTEAFVVRFWSPYTFDTAVREFTIYTGIPMIEIEPIQKVKKGRLQKIEFDVINVGQVTDTFHLELSGYASNWMYGLTPEVTLESGERKTIEVYVNVPNEVKNGDYQFTVSAEGSPRYAVTSTLRVYGGTQSITGLFAGIQSWIWIPLLILLLLLLLIPFLLWLFSRKKRRNGEENSIKNFQKFDDCC
ncbi:MAG: hypothetical protein QXY45_03525, partial [Candidatus Aenigmatarchaeota archaeon]